MKTKLRQLWKLLTDSLWFIPGLMIISSMALGLGLVELEVYYPLHGGNEYPLLFGVGADGSRGMLSAIASSMLTVAGLSFTLTLSAISQVSSQYSPRLLRNFMKDRINQFVMGYFTGSFAYCLIVLRTIRGGDEVTFVPSIAVLAGLLLALGGVLALILFIHHIAESMQVGTIIYKIMDETTDAIDKLFPQELGEPVVSATLNEKAKRLLNEPDGWTIVSASRSGYLQEVDSVRLLDWAVEHKMIVRLEHDTGYFIGKGLPMLSVRPVDGRGVAGKLTDGECDDLQDCLQLGRYRTVEQDVRFGIQQLVDVAIKALSPGINDTTTAIMAIDHLGVVIGRLVTRPFPSPFRTDGTQLLVLTRSAQFDQMMADAFDLIRISGKANHAVFLTLLRTFDKLAGQTHDSDRLMIIRRHAALVREFSDKTLETRYEKEVVNSL
ncbi:DUF2254 domain-containing protein [Spirosoma rhododendri]|uniref:DUF2254 domain-containing protein n=1 Tax=Spirosoma rhododendri TaxID=2728024 RepID=A0A7L5DR74_9BACT|nr:DUF2254 domain-containing protein [Spirosoma rhododendri]QJD79723.1 DUF2254 domain-containing protein [Spirosoma rhododendri]